MKFFKKSIPQAMNEIYEEIDGKWQKVGALAVGGGAAVASQSSFALAPATLADLTTGISFADVSLAILAVAALAIAVIVTWKGAHMVIRAVRSL